MKKFSVLLFCALFAVTLSAQQRTGNITGTVVDDQGNALPGVNLTLTGGTIAPIPSQTNAEGKFRFLSLFPGNDFAIKAELPGFKTKTETGIIVNVSRSSDITITMEQGALEEQVTVIATTPVVDAKKTQITHTVNYAMLQSLPTARDPWVVLQMTPSVQMDRENVGGVESGQQSYYQAKGSTTQEWTVDGMQTTDKSSVSSPGYYDFDSFEELNISTGTLDVEHRDPGIIVNVVTRRGGNKTSLGGRFFYTDSHLQSDMPQSRLDEYGVAGYNRANDIKDFGFNAGGPLVKDKAWWWVSYGVQQVKTYNQLNVADDTYLNNYNAKINLQLLPQNRLELLYMLGDKTKFGRSSSEYYPPGWRQGSKQVYGNPTFKFQDEHMFGDNLFVSLRLGKTSGGFGLKPEGDLTLSKPSWYDVENQLYYNSQTWFYSDRPHPYGVAQIQYFNDNLIFGSAHEMKIGFEVNNNDQVAIGGYPGNLFLQNNYYYDIVDYDGDGVMDNPRDDFGVDLTRVNVWRRRDESFYMNRRLAAYFSDTISKGRFNFVLSFRFDYDKPSYKPMVARTLFTAADADAADPQLQYYDDIALAVFEPNVITAINNLMPEQTRPAVQRGKNWTMFSPRVGMTYDLFGDGKTIFKLAYALYKGGGLGTGYWTPYGVGGWMDFWWDDLNGNGLAGLDELYWADISQGNLPIYNVFDGAGNFIGDEVGEYGSYWGSFTWGSTAVTKPTSFVDLANWKPSQTHEISASIEREIFHDFGVSASFTWKKNGRWSSSYSYYPSDPANTPNDDPNLNDHYRTKDDYYLAGVVPTMLYMPGPDGIYGNADDIAVDPGEAAGRPWYALKGPSDNPDTRATSYSLTLMQPSNAYNIYYGADFVFTKRLANKWMANGSFTYQFQKHHYGDGWVDPSTNWAYDNQIFAFSQGGGSGKISQRYFSRWMVKLMGLYQLPWDLSVSGTISGHEGTFNTNSFTVQNYTSYNNPLYNTRDRAQGELTHTYNNSDRIQAVWVFNLKLEKMLKLGNGGRMYFSVDAFNVMNSQIVTRKYDRSLGTFRFTADPDLNPDLAPGDAGYEVPYAWYAPGSTQGKNNELLNPLIFRLGVRFEI
jgi:hypothetical protein